MPSLRIQLPRLRLGTGGAGPGDRLFSLAGREVPATRQLSPADHKRRRARVESVPPSSPCWRSTARIRIGGTDLEPASRGAVFARRGVHRGVHGPHTLEQPRRPDPRQPISMRSPASISSPRSDGRSPPRRRAEAHSGRRPQPQTNRRIRAGVTRHRRRAARGQPVG